MNTIKSVSPDTAASNISTWPLDCPELRMTFHDVVRDLNVNQFMSALRVYSTPHYGAFVKFLQETNTKP